MLIFISVVSCLPIGFPAGPPPLPLRASKEGAGGLVRRHPLCALAPEPQGTQIHNLLNSASLSLGATIACPSDLSTRVFVYGDELPVGPAFRRSGEAIRRWGDPASGMSAVGMRLNGQRHVAQGCYYPADFSSHGDLAVSSLSVRYPPQHLVPRWLPGDRQRSVRHNSRAFQFLPVGM